MLGNRLNWWAVGVLSAGLGFGCGNAAEEAGLGASTGGSPGGGSLGALPVAEGAGGMSTGTGGAPQGGGGASTTGVHGNVDLVAYYRPSSAWDGNTAAQAAVEALFIEYEGALRTGGNFDAKIEVCFDDQADSGAFGYVTFAEDAPATLIEYRGTNLMATTVWSQIVLGSPDPNGDPDEGQTKGCDFYLQYDFSQSQPESNVGLVRHECIHGFGADVGVEFAIMSSGNELSFPAEGTTVVPTIHDLNIVDENGNHLVEFDSASGEYKIGKIQFLPTFGEWTNPLGPSAGTFFLGKNDDGTELKMPNETRPCPWDPASACDFFNEMPKLMKAGGDFAHPTWNSLDYPDRAWLRAMGYTLAMDLN